MKLFESGRIGKLSIKNRIAMAPMDIGDVEPGITIYQQGIDYFATRAKGGTGLIITGTFRASRELEPDLLWPTVDSKADMAALRKLAEVVHTYGTKLALQMGSGVGRVGRSGRAGRSNIVSASAVPCMWDPSIIARELTIEEIEREVKAYELAAGLVSAVGIDAIELHGHEGYMFDQFMTALWNKRTDKYGGDLEGRLRFPIEVIQAVKRGAGADFPIIFRYGLTHYLEGGREVEEGLELARRLEAAGVDALHIDAGCYENWYWPHPPTYQPPGCMVDLAKMVKKVVKIPVIAVGRLGYPELAERVLQEGKADFVALGRALIADPEWPNKVKEKRLEDICPCLGDHECMGGLKRTIGVRIRCTVNAAAAKEKGSIIEPAARKKSILVVGGGPGGMEAARVAALRGHKVTLWEKGNALGGNLIPASIPDFKHDYRRLINYLTTQIKKLGVTIELQKEATPELVQQMKPEAVFIATGGIPIIPEIPGVGQNNVVTAVDVLLGRKEARESVVVVGGGLVGCETALYLAQKGKRLTIVEIMESVARHMYKPNGMYLLKLLTEAKVEILTETNVLEIVDEGITVADKYGKTSTLEADTVVVALGLEPQRELLGALKDKVPEVYAIGDCVQPRKVINAIWEGFRTARLI